MVASVVLVAKERGIRHFVSLLEPLFYRALRISFRAPMTLLGPKTFYKGDYVLPVVIDTRWKPSSGPNGSAFANRPS